MRDDWALVVVDGAPQHKLNPEMSQKAQDQKVLFQTLPEGQTHVWQPCDMFAIAAIKKKVDKSWDEQKETLWASLPNDEAVKSACLTSTPVLKARMFSHFSYAIDTLDSEVVSLSWEASFLSTILFCHPPRISTAFWNFGCNVPSLQNLESQEATRSVARSAMLTALNRANAAVEEDLD